MTKPGAVLSILMVRLALALLPAASVQVVLTTCPALSAVSVTELTVQVGVETASVAVKLTVTLVLFQPLALAKGVWLLLITGGVVSVGVPSITETVLLYWFTT